MRKFKFQTRLIIGFSSILLFSVIIALTSIYQIRQIRINSEALYQHPLTVSNSVRDINISINAIHRSMKDVVLAENNMQLNESVQLVNEHDQLIHEAFEVVEERFLGDKKVVDETFQAYINWEIIRNEVIALKKLGENQKAANITKGKGAVHVQLLFDKTKVLTDFAQNKANEFYSNTKRSEQKSILILFITFSIILSLSALVAVFIARSISRPIHKFIDDISTLYRKEKPFQKGKLLDKSEQEILGDTAKELKKAYEDLKTFNKILDKKIEARTKELKVAKEKAEESDQLKSAFLANMSHEIRTPLNSILGFSEFLENDDLPKEKKRTYLDMIQSGGERLLTIISDIVDISKIDARQLKLEMGNHNLNSLINKLYNQFAIDPKSSSIKLFTTTDLPNEESCIQTDETRLYQILSNLIENALKYTPEGQIEFGYTLQNNQLLFHVIDSGIGISPCHHKIIFERFRQTDKAYTEAISGTGLGLSIAKGLVELFGGKIWVESIPGKGAQFYFKIPYLPASNCCVKNGKETHSSNKVYEGTTVLVAEDEQSNYVYIRDLLTQYKYKVLHAQNGQEAVQIIRKNGDIDLVLMDIKMPVMNGLEATREIRKTNPGIPVIAQTAYAMADDKIKALEAGCNDYLAKPISIKILSDILQKHLA